MSQTNFILMIMYDIPINDKPMQRVYRKLNNFLQKSGFYLLQNSIYIKPLSEKKTSQKYISQIKELIVESGHIRALILTYQQFLAIESIIGEDTWGEKLIKTKNSVIQI